LTDDEEDSVIEFYKRTDLKKCAYMAAHARNDVKPLTLMTAWRKIKVVSESKANTESVEPKEGLLVNTVSKIPGPSHCGAEEVDD
jgi:hypothetical protein